MPEPVVPIDAAPAPTIPGLPPSLDAPPEGDAVDRIVAKLAEILMH